MERTLSCQARLSVFGDKKTSETSKLESEIAAIEKEIDKDVYKIYGINEEEGKVISA